MTTCVFVDDAIVYILVESTLRYATDVKNMVGTVYNRLSVNKQT